MATDIIARGMAANAKKSVTELGDKVESEKWIGTKAEWEVVDKSTIKDGTIVYITDDETVILYDKAEMEKIAAQVAADRKAAETAAQTAQAVADSLPEDYVTAVGKIAENTAEIANVKLTDKELTRRVNALYDMGQGITHRFETDSDTAYAKTVPTGGRLMSVKNVGGRSIVFNQLIPDSIIHVTVTIDEDVTEDKWISRIEADTSNIISAHGHKVLGKCVKDASNPTANVVVRFGDNNANISNGYESEHSTEKGIYSLQPSVKNGALYYRAFAGATAGTYGFTLQLFDLTAMFGSGNEPASVEEFEKMFPTDYYPYNTGEVVSAGTESIMQQGKNLFDYTDKTYHGANASKVENGIVYTKGLTTTVLNIPTIAENKYTLSFKVKSNAANQDGLRWSLQKGKNTSYAHDSSLIKSEVGYTANTEYQAVATFVATTDFVSLCTIVGMVYDVQLELGDTATDYSPFYQTEYPIPEAIRNLPGYGWSAGTAKNWVDYENKKYVQCVNSVDLRTKNWLMYKDGDYTPFFYLNGISDIRGGTPNFLCSKYQYAKIGVTDNVTGLYVLESTIVRVRDTAYTDATAFKQAMQDVMLYYELATPIVTDISDLLTDDFLRNIEVEAGGSVTFKNSNDNYHIPVPSEEEYIVKLSEVGGTT